LGGGGEGQALLVFQRWLCALAKTKCAICAFGFFLNWA